MIHRLKKIQITINSQSTKKIRKKSKRVKVSIYKKKKRFKNQKQRRIPQSNKKIRGQ